VLDGASNRVLANVRVGYYVYDLVYVPAEDKVYCPSWVDGRVAVIDCATDSVIARVRVDTLPRCVTYSPVQNKVYVAGSGYPNMRVTVIDCSTDSVVAHIPIPYQCRTLGYNSVDDKVYCGMDNSSRDMRVIDCRSDSVVDTIPDCSGQGLFVRFNPRYDKVYVGLEGRVLVVDGKTDTVLAVIHMPQPWIFPRDVCFDSAVTGQRAYVAVDGSAHALFVVDAATDRVLKQVTGRAAGYGAAYSATSGRVYVLTARGGEDADSVSALDCASAEFVADVDVGRDAQAVLWSCAQNRGYVANALSSSVSVIRDTVSQGVVERPTATGQPVVTATVAMGSLWLGGKDPAELFDASGSIAARLWPGANNLRGLVPGVYFLRYAGQARVMKLTLVR
jgi:YVTN family beta-propeller protein